MANHDQFPSDNTNIGEKIPHTGKLPPEEGGEYPVREYKETSLQDAHDQKLLEVPDTLEDAHGRGLLPDPATVVRTPEATPSRSRRRNMLIAAGTGAAALAAVVGLAIGKSGGDNSNEHTPDKPVATATPNVDPTQTSEPTPDTEPTTEPSDPYAETSWREYISPEEAILVEKYPTVDDQAVRVFEILTTAANNATENDTIPYEYSEALFGGSHYDTDMNQTRNWLDSVSATISHINNDFAAEGSGQPEFTVTYKAEGVVEDLGDNTAIVEVSRTTNIADFSPEYQERINGYLENVSPTGQETLYWKIGMRYEEGRALVSQSETLLDYTPPAK